MTYIAPDPPSAYAIPPFAGKPDLGCRDADPEDFFVRNEDSGPAKRLCRRCPYRWECLEWALGRPENFGVWGGATPKERNKIRAGAKCGTNNGYQAHRRDGSDTCDACIVAHAAHQRGRYRKPKGAR